MSDINVVTLSGRVGQDPESVDAGGTPLSKFSLAVSGWAGKDKPETTTWVTINLWGNRTKVADYIKKGMKLFVRGRLSIRKVGEGEKTRYYTSVEADEVVLPDKESSPTAAKSRKTRDSGDLF